MEIGSASSSHDSLRPEGLESAATPCDCVVRPYIDSPTSSVSPRKITALSIFEADPCTPPQMSYLTPKVFASTTHNNFSQFDELLKVLSPEYAQYAFCLPDDSGSIWSLMASDMETLAFGSEVFTEDECTLLKFLCRFFSNRLLQVVADNLKDLEQSHLGIQYTFKQSKVSIGKSIIEGIREEASENRTVLATFLGQVWERTEEIADVDKWQIVSRRNSKRNDRGGPSSGNGEGSSNGAAGGDARAEGEGNVGGSHGSGGNASNEAGQGASSSGAGGSDANRADPEHFPSMEQKIVLVELPSFVTPPRVDPEKKLKVRQRSLLFKDKMQGMCGRLYNPCREQNPGFVSLYHGTRTSSLKSFQGVGILPQGLRSEFCRLSAFYASNSVIHAFERPLHYKLGRSVDDAVSVLEFYVDVAVLHGEKAPPGDSTPFSIQWFSRPSEEWKRFCIGNMAVDPSLQALAPSLHTKDIVIGPVCIPMPGGTDMGAVYDRVGRGDVYVCQVAFCTPRSWRWLEACLRRVYVERREALFMRVE